MMMETTATNSAPTMVYEFSPARFEGVEFNFVRRWGWVKDINGNWFNTQPDPLPLCGPYEHEVYRDYCPDGKGGQIPSGFVVCEVCLTYAPDPTEGESP